MRLFVILVFALSASPVRASEFCDSGMGRGGAHTGVEGLTPQQLLAYGKLSQCSFEELPELNCRNAIQEAFDLDLSVGQILEALTSNPGGVDMERACRILVQLTRSF